MDEATTTHTYTMDDLLRVMGRLRDPQHGCPWDLQQDFASIAPYTLEECYELVDALERNDLVHVADELGDVLFQVVFYSQLGVEQSLFSFESVVHGVTDKLVRRHPHVFAKGEIEGIVEDEAEIADIKATWESIKAEERAQRDQHGLLADVPVTLPALSRAQKIQKRAARVGFDWDAPAPVLAKLESEIGELSGALGEGDLQAAHDELGDVLFSAVNMARHLGADAEQLLRAATRKFETRFEHMESAAAESGSDLQRESATQLEARWETAKQNV